MNGLLLTLAGLLGLIRSVASVDSSDPSDPSDPSDEPITAQVRALELEPVTVGARAELSLIVLEAPERGLPLELRIAATPLQLDDNRLDWTAVVDPLATQPRLRASFTAPSEPGVHEVRATVDYSICGEQWCRRKHAELRWTVTVIAAHE